MPRQPEVNTLSRANVKQNLTYYEVNLQDLASRGISFFPVMQGSSCWFSGIVMEDSATHEDIKDICAKLKDESIEVRSFWKPVHLQKPYQDSPRGNMANSESLWQRIITLPCSTGITSKELEKVGEGIMSVLEL